MSLQQYLENVKKQLSEINSACIPKISENMGFGLYASGNIAQDTTVFSEDPIVAGQYSWGVVYGFLACHHCLRSLETAEEMARRLANDKTVNLPLPDQKSYPVSEYRCCPDCQITFCSEECLQTALQQYHSAVCTKGDQEHPLVQVDEMWRNMHYPPETTSLLLILKIIGIVITGGSIPHIFQYFYQCVESKAGNAHKVLQQEFITKLDLLRDALLQIYGSNALVQHLLERGNFVTLIALIGMNGQGIGTSSFADYCNRLDQLENLAPSDKTQLDTMLDEIYDKIDTHSGVFVDVEGTGLYQLQSKLNHSCDPNVQIVFGGSTHRLSVRAVRDIKEGEELYISYLSSCDLHSSRHSRRRFLLENYLFECECTKCLSQIHDPDVTSDEGSDSEMGD